MKKFATYISEWEENAKKDAYWAVLTSSQHEQTQWDRETFFKTGILEIDRLKNYIEKKQLPIPFQGKALDFGCGVGRLTQALSRHFQQVYGVDISKTMISHAKQANPASNIQFHHNSFPDLQQFPCESFDFIYSNIVLQHIAKKHQLQYLADFARLTKPGGWIIAQVPSGKTNQTLLNKMSSLLPYRFRKAIQIYMFKNRSKAITEFDFEINVCPQTQIQKMAADNKLEIKHIAYTNSCEPDFGGNLTFFTEKEASGYISPMYFMKKSEQFHS